MKENRTNNGNGLFAEQLARDSADQINKGRLNKPRVLIEESWLSSEERHYRFLSACFLIFHYYYDGNVDQHLLTLLNVDSERVEQKSVIDQRVRDLMSENDKTALSKRLCHYWRSLGGN